MNRGRIFNEEKVLYFADQEQMFHVQKSEQKDTDCSRIVDDLLKREMIELVDSDRTGKFYRTTGKGRMKLLRLQIQWRSEHGKDFTEHQKRLRALQENFNEKAGAA